MTSSFAVRLVAFLPFAPHALLVPLLPVQAAAHRALSQGADPTTPEGAAPQASPAASAEEADSPTPAARVLTLDEATRAALTQQPKVRQAHATTEGAFARADQGRASLLPQLTGTAAYQVSTMNPVQRPGTVPGGASVATQSSTFATSSDFNFGMGATQLIYDFGQTWGRYGAARSQAESQTQTERATRLQTLLSVRTSFFQARAQKALVAASRETLANQDRHLQQARGFVKLGTRPEIDLAQALTDVATARLAVITAENNYATSRALLNAAMGAMTGSDYEVSDDTLSPLVEEDQPLDMLVRSASAARPELAALSKLIDADRRLIRAAKGGYGPALTASTALIDARTASSNIGWNWNAAITLTWPLFQGFLVPAQVREAEANLAALEAQRDGVELQFRLEVEQARLAVSGAKAALAASGQVLVNAQGQLRLAEGRYRTGVGSIIELSDAQTTVVTAESQRVNADYMLSSARAQLLMALGRDTL